MLVQPNQPLVNTEPFDDRAMLDFLFESTVEALREHEDVDLVVWPESSLPPINPASRRLLAGIVQDAHTAASSISSVGPALLTGGSYLGDWQPSGPHLNRLRAGDRRNSVYFYEDGQQSPLRYDKTHLFPFGEYIPFRDTPPPLSWLHEFFQLFNPWGREHGLTPGEADTVFDVAGVRVVVPICFEDLFPYRCREMIFADGERRADVLVNVTNDGWFRGNQMAQHLQAAAFRSIETRTPTARSVNTGVSAIVDPLGRITHSEPAGQPGVVVGVVQMDARTPPYVLVGDAFAIACFVATHLYLIVLRLQSRARREARP